MAIARKKKRGRSVRLETERLGNGAFFVTNYDREIISRLFSFSLAPALRRDTYECLYLRALRIFMRFIMVARYVLEFQ